MARNYNKRKVQIAALDGSVRRLQAFEIQPETPETLAHQAEALDSIEQATAALRELTRSP